MRRNIAAHAPAILGIFAFTMIAAEVAAQTDIDDSVYIEVALFDDDSGEIVALDDGDSIVVHGGFQGGQHINIAALVHGGYHAGEAEFEWTISVDDQVVDNVRLLGIPDIDLVDGVYALDPGRMVLSFGAFDQIRGRTVSYSVTMTTPGGDVREDTVEGPVRFIEADNPGCCSTTRADLPSTFAIALLVAGVMTTRRN